jgi:hypothetical protein
MKVEVLTVEQVKISRWKWWSNWIDIAVFNYECRPYLIQMRISRTNAKSFRCVSTVGIFYRQCSCLEIGNLTQMKGGAE